MLKSNGTISYKLSDGRIETKNVSYIQESAGLVTIFEKDEENQVIKEIFIYDPIREKWYIPNGIDEYDEVIWKEFDGQVIQFEFNTRYYTIQN